MVPWGPNQQTSSRNYNGQISGKVMAIVLLIFSMRARWMIMIDTHWYDTIDYWTIVQYHHGNLLDKQKYKLYKSSLSIYFILNKYCWWNPPFQLACFLATSLASARTPPGAEPLVEPGSWRGWLGHMAGWELPELIRGFVRWENHWSMGDVPANCEPAGGYTWLQ